MSFKELSEALNELVRVCNTVTPGAAQSDDDPLGERPPLDPGDDPDAPDTDSGSPTEPPPVGGTPDNPIVFPRISKTFTRVTTDRSSAPADGSTPIRLTVEVKDHQNQPLKDVIVSLRTKLNTQYQFSPGVSATTDVYGKVVFQIKSEVSSGGPSGNGTFVDVYLKDPLKPVPQTILRSAAHLLYTTPSGGGGSTGGLIPSRTSDAHSSLTGPVAPVSTPGPATVTATVKDATGAPLEGINVRLVGGADPDFPNWHFESNPVVSNAQGKAVFRIYSENPGSVTLSAEAQDPLSTQMNWLNIGEAFGVTFV